MPHASIPFTQRGLSRLARLVDLSLDLKYRQRVLHTTGRYQAAVKDVTAQSFCMQALLTASNAAIGGPGTAAAMASSRDWPEQITPALLTGSLGYTIGTPIGLAVGALLQQM
jgi:hypothetical protein